MHTRLDKAPGPFFASSLVQVLQWEPVAEASCFKQRAVHQEDG